VFAPASGQRGLDDDETSNQVQLSTQISLSFSHSGSPPGLSQARLVPAVLKLKDAYLVWYQYYRILPKEHRYSLGKRVDSLLIEAIEMTTMASFLKPEAKLPYVQVAVRKVDTLKVMLLILWETKSLKDKQYITLSEQLDEAG
jgi:hypothetical protein